MLVRFFRVAGVFSATVFCPADVVSPETFTSPTLSCLGEEEDEDCIRLPFSGVEGAARAGAGGGGGLPVLFVAAVVHLGRAAPPAGPAGNAFFTPISFGATAPQNHDTCLYPCSIAE